MKKNLKLRGREAAAFYAVNTGTEETETGAVFAQDAGISSAAAV